MLSGKRGTRDQWRTRVNGKALLAKGELHSATRSRHRRGLSWEGGRGEGEAGWRGHIGTGDGGGGGAGGGEAGV